MALDGWLFAFGFLCGHVLGIALGLLIGRLKWRRPPRKLMEDAPKSSATRISDLVETVDYVDYPVACTDEDAEEDSSTSSLSAVLGKQNEDYLDDESDSCGSNEVVEEGYLRVTNTIRPCVGVTYVDYTSQMVLPKREPSLLRQAPEESPARLTKRRTYSSSKMREGYMFEVTVSKSSTSSKIGVVIIPTVRNVLRVAEVTVGMIANWNESNPTAAVEPGDFITSINGVGGDCSRMLSIVSTERKLVLMCKRPNVDWKR